MSRVRDKRTTALFIAPHKKVVEHRGHRAAIYGLSLGDTMAKPANSGKAWTSGQEAQLRQLAKGNTPTRVAGLKLGRTPASVQSKASQMGVSLKPTNQSPYGTKKK